MKYYLLLIIQPFLLFTLYSQDFTYTFAGKDKGKTMLNCEEEMILKFSIEDNDLEQVEYRVVNKSGEIKRLNASIVSIKANNALKMIIEAVNKTNGKKIGEISIPINCPPNLQIKFFGRSTNQVISKSLIKVPFDVQIIDSNNPDEKYEVSRYKIMITKNGKVSEYKFTNGKNLYAGQCLTEISTLKPGSVIVIYEVCYEKFSKSKNMIVNIPVGAINIKIQ